MTALVCIEKFTSDPDPKTYKADLHLSRAIRGGVAEIFLHGCFPVEIRRGKERVDDVFVFSFDRVDAMAGGPSSEVLNAYSDRFVYDGNDSRPRRRDGRFSFSRNELERVNIDNVVRFDDIPLFERWVNGLGLDTAAIHVRVLEKESARENPGELEKERDELKEAVRVLEKKLGRMQRERDEIIMIADARIEPSAKPVTFPELVKAAFAAADSDRAELEEKLAAVDAAITAAGYGSIATPADVIENLKGRLDRAEEKIGRMQREGKAKIADADAEEKIADAYKAALEAGYPDTRSLAWIIGDLGKRVEVFAERVAERSAEMSELADIARATNAIPNPDAMSSGQFVATTIRTLRHTAHRNRKHLEELTELRAYLITELGIELSDDWNATRAVRHAIDVLKAGFEKVRLEAVELRDEVASRPQTPIPMRLPCPACGGLHVDRGDFETKPHHTHACQHCGHVWRPALVATRGVVFLPGCHDIEHTNTEALVAIAAHYGIDGAEARAMPVEELRARCLALHADEAERRSRWSR